MMNVVSEEEWSAFFFKKHGIKTGIDIHDLDLTTDFINTLKESLRGGYDGSKPIIIAESKEKDIDGQLIDGLHRCYALQVLYEHENTKIEPSIRRESIRDTDHLRARRLHYELLNQSKSLAVSTKKADKSFMQILSDHPELDDLEKVTKFFVLMGFHNTMAITHIYNRLQSYEARKILVQRRAKDIATDTPSYGMTDWAEQSTNIPIVDLDITKQRISCKYCHKEMFAYVKEDRISKLEKA